MEKQSILRSPDSTLLALYFLGGQYAFFPEDITVELLAERFCMTLIINGADAAEIDPLIAKHLKFTDSEGNVKDPDRLPKEFVVQADQIPFYKGQGTSFYIQSIKVSSSPIPVAGLRIYEAVEIVLKENKAT